MDSIIKIINIKLTILLRLKVQICTICVILVKFFIQFMYHAKITRVQSNWYRKAISNIHFDSYEINLLRKYNVNSNCITFNVLSQNFSRT